MKEIAVKIYRERNFLKLTQQQLAEGICSVSYLCRLEKKKINPNPEIVNLLLNRLNHLKNDYELSDARLKNKEFGEQIFNERVKYYVSQQELCYGICSISYLSKIENNKIVPTPHIKELLCKRLEELKNKENLSLLDNIQVEKLYEKLIHCLNKGKLKRAKQILYKGLEETQNKHPKMHCLFLFQKYKHFQREGYANFLKTIAIPFFKELNDKNSLGILHIELAKCYVEEEKFKQGCEHFKKGVLSLGVHKTLTPSKVYIS